jgi:site-specific DNA-cytosine methylase
MISDANFKDEIKNRFALWNYFDTDHILSPTLTANLKNWYPTNFVIDRRWKNTNYCQYWFNSCQFVWQPDMCDICDGWDNYQEMYPIKTQFPIFRKIHPVECERLQWFPDNFTKYWINEKWNKIEISDTQRWKQLGNSISTNVLVKILYNIKKYI